MSTSCREIIDIKISFYWLCKRIIIYKNLFLIQCIITWSDNHCSFIAHFIHFIWQCHRIFKIKASGSSIKLCAPCSIICIEFEEIMFLLFRKSCKFTGRSQHKNSINASFNQEINYLFIPFIIRFFFFIKNCNNWCNDFTHIFYLSSYLYPNSLSCKNQTI